MLFAALRLKIVPKEGVKKAGSFLVTLLPLIFVASALGLLEYRHIIAGHAVAFGFLIVCSLVITFAVSGLVA